MSSRGSSSRSRAIVAASNPDQVIYHDDVPPQFEKSNHQRRWRALTKRPTGKTVISALAPHWDTLKQLGLYQMIVTLFKNTGLESFAFMLYPTYAQLVYEFFTTFEPLFEGNWCVGWRYTIRGRTFEWSREELCRMLGIPGEGSTLGQFTEADLTDFWTRISDMSFHDANCSPKAIRDGHWKETHRLISININSRRDEGSRVTRDDLRIMLAMERGMDINYFQLISSHMRDMADVNGTVKGLGCSSLITMLATNEGFYFSSRADDEKALDRARMIKMKMIDPRTDEWVVQDLASRPRSSGSRRSTRERSSGFEWEEYRNEDPSQAAPSNAIVPYAPTVIISSDEDD